MVQPGKNFLKHQLLNHQRWSHGVNYAWNQYGRDFGTNSWGYAGVFHSLHPFFVLTATKGSQFFRRIICKFTHAGYEEQEGVCTPLVVVL